ncbi:MAG: prepilin-type N-terminal cleavage/methylation domain-containing protein [Acidobacteriota bacterium]|nr:prepilin-type N-terminal cleavage/methylation domain-containing protein [Acidobacteriota bacterium]
MYKSTICDEVNQQRRHERGFSMLEVLIVIAIIAIVASFATMGITTARASMRLIGATHEFGESLEQARLDAVRRRDTAGTTRVEILDNTSYRVTMDFNSDGTVDAPRTITLPDGATFDNVATQTITFNLRGRTIQTLTAPGSPAISNQTVSFSLINTSIAGSSPANVTLTGSGDVTYTNAFVPANPNVAALNSVTNP